MGSCREMLTIQLGSYANYVGSHFWNIQETGFSYNANDQSEICHDVLYREGSTIQGDLTFTPRVLCVDRVSKLPPVQLLEEPLAIPSAVWDVEKTDRIEKDGVGLHQFIQDLDSGADTNLKDYSFESTARGWGDFLRSRLHPRSLVSGYQNFEDQLEDRIRAYVEECDNIQGFHLIVDGNDKYPEVFQFLDDEFASKSRIALPVIEEFEASPWVEAAPRLLRVFQNFYLSGTMSTLSVPLSCVSKLSLKPEETTSFANLSRPQTNYQSSAILASFLETFSLAYRTRNQVMDISDVIAGLTSRGWKFSSASLALPFPMVPGTTLQQSLEARDDDIPLWSNLTPGSIVDNCWYQSFVLRGVPDSGVFLQYLQYLSSSVSAVKSISQPMPTSQPFPKIFSSHVSTRGSVDKTATRASGFEVASTPVLAGLHACPSTGDMLSDFTALVSKIDIRRIPHSDMESDLFTESLEAMRSIAKAHSTSMDLD